MKKNKQIIRVFNSIDPKYRGEVRDSSGNVIVNCKKLNEAWNYVSQLKVSNKSIRSIRINKTYTEWLNEEGNSSGLISEAKISVPDKYSVSQRFYFMKQMAKMVVDDISSGAIICGPAGIGKTWSVTEILNERKYKENIDYIFVKGNISPLGLYRTLYYNSDKLIIFDDCDNALFNEVCANLLKAALDTNDKRVITWSSPAVMNMDIEEQFEFTGRILFISNLDEAKVDRAIISRTLCIDLRMSRKDVMERIISLVPVICSDIAAEDRDDLINFIKKHIDSLLELNLRTLIKLAKIQKIEENWKQMAEYLFCR